MPRPRPRPRPPTPRTAIRSQPLFSTASDAFLFHLLVLTILTALAVLLAGCEGVDEQEPEAVGQPPGAAAVDDPGAPAPATGAAATSTSEVEVRLHDRLIEMPSSLPAGETSFMVVNTGAVVHGFEVEGQGIERVIEGIDPGATQSLTVTLQPGTYTVYCPVENHRGEGMETQLRVIR